MGDAADPAPRSKTGWLVWPFAALGVLTAIAIVWLAVELSSEFPAHAPAIVAADHTDGLTLTVGNVTALQGTDLIAIEINALDDGTRKAVSSYSAEETRNLLFLDRKTGLSRRVLPNNSAIIAHVDYLPAEKETTSHSAIEVGADGDYTQKAAPAAYYLLTIERQLKNGNKVDDLLVGTLATGKQAVVMTGLSGLDQSGMIDATHLGVVVREGEGLYYRVIDIPALKHIESHKIEIG
jgi:hypothetical protein